MMQDRATLVFGSTWALRLLLLVGVAFSLSMDSIAQEPADWKEKLVASTTESSEQIEQAKELLGRTLSSVMPPKTGKQKSLMVEGRYVLCGDIFDQKKICALVELISGLSLGWGNSDNTTIGVGFAIWNGKKWEPKGFLRVSPIWRQAGWKESENDRIPIRPAERPFEMLQVTPDQPPLAIVVGDVWKYWQEHFIVALDSATESLMVLDQTKHAEPVNGYLRLFSDSGHRSTFVEWEFTKWTGKRLVPRAFWHEGTNEATDGTTCKATNYGVGNGKPLEYVIEIDPNSSSATITRDGASYARIDLKALNQGEQLGGPLNAYLFEKAIDLPRNLYPNVWKGKQPDRLEKIAKISVTGNPQAVRKFSFSEYK